MTNFHSMALLESISSPIDATGLDVEHAKLLIDCGTDVRFALEEAKIDPFSIDAVYISHLHADHCGGLEWFAFKRYFTQYPQKPILYAHPAVMALLWDHMKAGMALGHQKTQLNTFFDVRPVEQFYVGLARLNAVQTVHFYDGSTLMPSFGLRITEGKHSAFFSGDTQFCPSLYSPFYQEASLIFHDCEIYDWQNDKLKSGVHAHYSDLRKLPSDIKSKMWLYHYQDGDLPPNDGFAGFVKKGAEFNFDCV